MNIAQVLFDRAREAPERTALVFEDGRTWSWGILDRVSAQVALLLQERGVARSDRVAIVVPNRPEVVALLFGVWRLGAVPVTISSLYNEAELTKTVGQAQPRLLVITPTTPPAGEWDTLCLAPDSMERWERAARALPSIHRPARMEGAEEAVVVFTGGTTGLPKPVVTTHGGTIAAVHKLAEVSKGRPGPYELAHPAVAPNLLALPLFHSGGQQTLLFAFYVGRPLLLMTRFDARRMVELVVKHRVDNLFLMPTMLYDLCALEDPVDLSPVRVVLVAGQALDSQLRRRFEERFEIPIATNYGSTEVGHVAGWTRADLAAGRWKPGSAGRVYKGVRIEIRDQDGKALGVGEVGEICVRSDLVKGYLGDGEAGSELIRNGWVHSGDVGYVDPDGVLFLVGRKRDMIKTGGFQIWPTELEEALRSHPMVADVAVIGVPNRRLGEVPKAYVVPVEQAPEEMETELMDYVKNRLAHFKAVRQVELVVDLPRTETGKINRVALEELHLEKTTT
jgi:long-chain acyl-CoA synthetase